MALQVIADIRVSDAVVGSDFIESYFLENMAEEPMQLANDSSFIFTLLLDVLNESSGSGSIDKPTLILSFNKCEHAIEPVTKDKYNIKIDE